MEPLPETPRRGRKSAVRQEILRSAEALLLEGGADGLSVRKVAERAGCSAPTLYHHFGDKSGLVDAVLEERFAEVLEVMRRVPRGSQPASHFRELALAFIRFALANPGHYRLLTTTPRPRDADLLPSAEAARTLVKNALAEVARAGGLAAADAEEAFQITWAELKRSPAHRRPAVGKARVRLGQCRL